MFKGYILPQEFRICLKWVTFVKKMRKGIYFITKGTKISKFGKIIEENEKKCYEKVRKLFNLVKLVEKMLKKYIS